jgi:plasmid stabilization system protein ParE
VTNKRYRFPVLRNYVIVYCVENEDLLVVRVLHGARDLRRLFKKD